MSTHTPRRAATALPLVARRGAGAGALAGTLLAGLAGTVVFPVVSTFFSAILGAVAGTAAGALSGLVVWLVARVTTGDLPVRVTSALAWLAASASMVGADRGTATGWTVLGDVVLVVAAGVIGGFVGPMVARGFAPVPIGKGGTALPVSRIVGRAILWGTAAGVAVGAVAGLVIGLVTYPPTALFALVEAGVLGSVSGVVLALLVAAVVVLPRMRVLR